jgi:prepilin-type N-terminal cleavage/methylation domain-containing protein
MTECICEPDELEIAPACGSGIMPMSVKQERNAFSLIELLVVFAIIAILAALMLVGVARSKDSSRQTMCLSNLRQLDLGIRMYCDDANDLPPAGKQIGGMTNLPPWIAYKELMKSYVGLRGASSPRDKIFACPADTFYYDWQRGLVSSPHHNQAMFDFSSYTFNGIPPPGIGEFKLDAIKRPARTILVAESPSFYPYSWHEPKPPQPGGVQPAGMVLFNNAKNVVGFVDGHVTYLSIYWGNIITNGGFMACFYDPPAGYDYRWSGD